MASRDDDFPSAGQTFSVIMRYGAVIIVAGFLLWLLASGLGFFATPVKLATGVTEKVFNAQNALDNYRWFYASSGQLEAKKGQIALSKAALEAAADDRKEARRVELLGAQQSCMSLVGEYNARSFRADSVVFKYPEKFLPSDWPGEMKKLPVSFDQAMCN